MACGQKLSGRKNLWFMKLTQAPDLGQRRGSVFCDLPIAAAGIRALDETWACDQAASSW